MPLAIFQLRRIAFSSAVAAALVLSACGQDAEGRAASETRSGDQAVPSEASGVRGDRAVRHAMRCWGVTHGSFTLHMAAPDRAAGFPRATGQDYNAWANQGAILIREQGGSLADYDALKSEFQVSFTRQTQRDELRPVLEACLRTVPTAALDVDQPILTGE